MIIKISETPLWVEPKLKIVQKTQTKEVSEWEKEKKSYRNSFTRKQVQQRVFIRNLHNVLCVVLFQVFSEENIILFFVFFDHLHYTIHSFSSHTLVSLSIDRIKKLLLVALWSLIITWNSVHYYYQQEEKVRTIFLCSVWVITVKTQKFIVFNCQTNIDWHLTFRWREKVNIQQFVAFYLLNYIREIVHNVIRRNPTKCSSTVSAFDRFRLKQRRFFQVKKSERQRNDYYKTTVKTK